MQLQSPGRRNLARTRFLKLFLPTSAKHVSLGTTFLSNTLFIEWRPPWPYSKGRRAHHGLTYSTIAVVVGIKEHSAHCWLAQGELLGS